MLFDTHAHPYLSIKKSEESILESFFGNGGIYLNTISVDIESCHYNLELSKKYDGVYASLGIHPSYVLEYKTTSQEILIRLEKLIFENKQNIIALGEIGLDYYWLEKMSLDSGYSKGDIVSLQKFFFRAQIQLAQRLDLPVVIHNREAAEDIYKILVEENCSNFVLHCYSENYVFAEKILKFAPNAMLGFGGILTYKTAIDIQETAKKIPLRNILIETDSPYLTPSPLRGKEENEPLYTKYVLNKLAEIREESFEEIEKNIFQNSLDFFKISH